MTPLIFQDVSGFFIQIRAPRLLISCAHYYALIRSH